MPEEKENLLSRQLSRPMTLLSPNSTPRSTPRSTPARSMSPLSLHLSMLNSSNNLTHRQRRYRFAAPKFYSVPHNRVCEEGESVRFQCAIAGHPIPWSTWDKDGIIVTPSTRFTIKERDDMRYLEIEEVCFEDAGLYRITLENDYGRIEATARLDIIKNRKSSTRGIRASSAPSNHSRSVSRRIMGYSTKIGGRMALATQTTRASSIPSKKTVYHNGYDITSCERLSITENENEILIEIESVKTYDEGEYTLVLENDESIFSTSTFVKVLYEDDEDCNEKLLPRIAKELTDITSIEGLPLDLTFTVDCKIPFDYIWMKDDDVLINSEDFSWVINSWVGCISLNNKWQTNMIAYWIIIITKNLFISQIYWPWKRNVNLKNSGSVHLWLWLLFVHRIDTWSWLHHSMLRWSWRNLREHIWYFAGTHKATAAWHRFSQRSYFVLYPCYARRFWSHMECLWSRNRQRRKRFCGELRCKMFALVVTVKLFP